MDAIAKAYANVIAKWADTPTRTVDELSAALAHYTIRFAYNSGRIENQAITYHDTRDIFERGKVSSYTGDLRTLFEIQDQKECHSFLLETYGRHAPLDENTLLDTHRTLTKGTYDEHRWSQGERPGTYKTGDYVVGATDSGLPSAEFPEAMRELLGELSAVNEQNVLTVAAYFHLSLESIHPFADGNGRTGRALMNYLLVSNGHPPIIVFDEDKVAYYSALQVWDLEADLDPIKDFLHIEAIKTWRSN